MDDLVAFYRARLDEDEKKARAVPQYPEEAVGVELYFGTEDAQKAMRAFMDHFDEERMLREVEAERATIDDYEYAIRRRDQYAPGTDSYRHYDHRVYALHRVLLREAAVHADHPDYKESWRP